MAVMKRCFFVLFFFLLVGVCVCRVLDRSAARNVSPVAVTSVALIFVAGQRLATSSSFHSSFRLLFRVEVETKRKRGKNAAGRDGGQVE